MSKAKLRGGWATTKLDAPRHSVTVLLLEQNSDGWHLIVERHQGCMGVDPHDGCKVMQRFVGPARPTREVAESEIASVLVRSRTRPS